MLSNLTDYRSDGRRRSGASAARSRSSTSWITRLFVTILAPIAPADASQCVDLDEGVFGPGGTLCVDPVGMTVTSNGIITFTLTVGSNGFAQNGLVQIDVPGQGRRMSPVQVVTPGAAGFIAGFATTNGVQVQATVSSAPAIAQFQLLGGGLDAGDQIIMQYTTVMPKVAGTIYWRFRTDWDAINGFEPDNTGGHYLGPGFFIEGEQAAYVQLTAPGDVVMGEPFAVAAVAFDKYANLAAPGTGGTLSLQSTAPAGQVSGLPDTFDFSTNGGVSMAEFAVTYGTNGTEGFQRIFDADTTGLPVFTHYSYVHAAEPTYRCLFGDTHFHTGSGDENAWDPAHGGGDHVGGYTYVDQAYNYGRDVARLDFASSSEHAGALMTSNGWEAVQAITEDSNTNGIFTTFRAFEWTNFRPCHQIVLYRGSQGARLSTGTYDTYPKLIAALDDQPDAMAIPHRQSIDGPFETSNIDERYARLYEFHSMWTSGNPQEYEFPMDDPNGKSLQYAWANTNGINANGKKRLHVGVIASSDNHRQTPGFNAYTASARQPGSLAVVLARANTRDDIWDALYHRRTYGTTGPRIYAYLEADGHRIGDGYISTNGSRSFTVRAAGAYELAEVSLVKFDPAVGRYIDVGVTTNGLVSTSGFTVNPGTFANGGYTYAGTIVDSNALPASTEEVLYYLRVKQKDLLAVDTNGFLPGSVAVTTPIWVAGSECNSNGYPDAWEIAGNGELEAVLAMAEQLYQWLVQPASSEPVSAEA